MHLIINSSLMSEIIRNSNTVISTAQTIAVILLMAFKSISAVIYSRV